MVSLQRASRWAGSSSNERSGVGRSRQAAASHRRTCSLLCWDEEG
jgi:hypothetical protein